MVHGVSAREKLSIEPGALIIRAIARLSACVMGGVCAGHPRCQVYHCTQRLRSQRDRHCKAHRNLDAVCAIAGCEETCTDGKRTCSAPNHRSVEEERRQRGRALVELKRRLEARNVSSGTRAPPEKECAFTVLDDPDLDDPPETSNVAGKASKTQRRQPKTTLTRRWTHNEQLLVRPCGVIVSRATFFEAESLPNARVSVFSPSAFHSQLNTPSAAFPQRHISKTLSAIPPFLHFL